MMKKNNSSKRGPQEGNHPSAPPEKVGWVRKFCGKGIFREIWKNRYVVLRGDQLYISDKEQVQRSPPLLSSGKGHPGFSEETRVRS
uniref:Pleckstrin homology domain containing O1 n=1 Tax=Myotis myotis TaxID=51298 RepID=A0A7J7SSK8_MYOMY|nr:pleckstrin homology domain containing O1 [Myotis myotis]